MTCKGTSTTCTSCKAGSFLNGDECKICSDGCKECSIDEHGEICIECIDGYFISEGKCKKCNVACATCHSYDYSSYCYSCAPGYYTSTKYSIDYSC